MARLSVKVSAIRNSIRRNILLLLVDTKTIYWSSIAHAKALEMNNVHIAPFLL